MRRCAYTPDMHVFTLRLPAALYAKLQRKAHRDKASANCIAVEFIAAGLLDSPLAARPKPEDVLPWLAE